MLKCILFDLDGVLVEARDWHYHALNKALKRISGTEISLDEHLSDFNGLPTAKKLEMLIALNRIRSEDTQKIWQLKQDLTIETIEEMASIDYNKMNLLTALKTRGLKIGCVTNSIRQTAKLMLVSTGQFQFMDILISNEDINIAKPDPEGYITAMNILGCKPEETIIVEDSEYGIQAAEAAGAYVLKVGCSEDVTKECVLSFIKALK